MQWVIDKYYYVINFKYFYRPRIYPVFFISRQAAIRAIKQNIPIKKERIYYEIIKGKKLKDFETTYVLTLGKLGKFTKYQYPENLKIHKKSYRTKLRRRLRRMGMLTLTKQKGNIGDRPAIVKLIRNTQKVAMNKNTMACSFQLERKKPKYYFIILKKRLSKKKGFLFHIKALLVDIADKKVRKVKVNIYRKDILIPHLLATVNTLYGKDNYILDRYRKEISKIHKTHKERDNQVHG